MSLQDNSFTDMLQSVSSVQLPDKIKIVKNQLHTGGSINKPSQNINKLLSMLTSESNTSNNGETDRLENDLRNMLTLKGGKKHKDDDDIYQLKHLFQKYNVKTVNGIKSSMFIKNHMGAIETETSALPTINTNESETSPLPQINMNDSETSPNDSETSPNTTATELSGGARGMNPGFKAFIDLKKTIAEKLGIPNGPKAAKIAGSIQKEMKVKYADLTSVQLAAKGLEHFNKDPSKYKKMV